MNENEIKDKLNELRQEIDQKKREINEILSEVKVHQRDIFSLRQARDQGNDDCKRLSQEARQLRDKRDEMNAKIAALKEERRKINDQIKSLSGDIKDSKEKRDELNRSARGSDASLIDRYEHDMDALLSKDIPLDREVRLYDTIFALMERVEAAKKATSFHKKVVSTYDGIKSLDERADALSTDIRALAEESEKYHLKAVEIYSIVDETRKKADESHAKLLEKYNIVNPLRDKVTAIKKEIDAIESQTAPYDEEMAKLRSVKEGERKAQIAVEAKQKLKSSKRISLDDFRAILEDAGQDGEPAPAQAKAE